MRRCFPVLLAALFSSLGGGAIAPARAGGDPLAKTVSIDLQDAHLANVLRMMADDTGLNVILDPAVDRKITLKLGQVTWRQFLDLSLRLYGLRAEYQGNVVMIAPQDSAAFRPLAPPRDESPIETRMIRVRYADAKNLAAILERSVLSADGTVSVDERTSTLILRDHPERIAEAIRVIGHD